MELQGYSFVGEEVLPIVRKYNEKHAETASGRFRLWVYVFMFDWAIPFLLFLQWPWNGNPRVHASSQSRYSLHDMRHALLKF